MTTDEQRLMLRSTRACWTCRWRSSPRWERGISPV